MTGGGIMLIGDRLVLFRSIRDARFLNRKVTFAQHTSQHDRFLVGV